jgi:hypothetical protein
VLGNVIGVGALLGVVSGNVWFCAPGVGKVLGLLWRDWDGMRLWFVLGVVLGFVLRL